MKKTLLILLLILTSTLIGCGSTTIPSLGTAPVISSLSFSPTSVSVGTGGGAITINVLLNFIDPDGDIAQFVVTAATGKESIVNLTGYDGITSAPVSINIAIGTSAPGSFNFEVKLIDSKGNESNRLFGTFIIN